MGTQIVRCPTCGEELGSGDDIYTIDKSDNVAGCTLCLHRHNAVEWFGEQVEEYAEQHKDYWRAG